MSKPETTIAVGETWRSPKTWWRIAAAWDGAVIVEGPRGSVRGSRDGGETWSELETVMTREGFLAWVRKTGAVKL